MLVSIATKSLQTNVFRLATPLQDADFLRTQGFDDENVDEMFDLLASRGISDNPEELCDEPFRPKPQLQNAEHRTRFSDGSFPIFYSSLEPETAEAERKYWFQKFAGQPTNPRTAYYSRFSCRFDGSTKDLRPLHKDWPSLTHDSDYGFCNRLGNEAVASGLDGLLTPSARRLNGTNLPVFKRHAVSNPVVHALVAMTLDPSSGEVALHEKGVEDS
ncbi:MAG: RES family NAD+ phosphorylase [Nitrospira sp.]|nr:RES family NAD+ phosphorylase [Nitrospira sp.]